MVAHAAAGTVAFARASRGANPARMGGRAAPLRAACPLRAGFRTQVQPTQVQPSARGQSLRVSAAAKETFPDFLPEEVVEVMEPAAVAMAQSMRRVPVKVSSRSQPVLTSVVGPTEPAHPDAPPVITLHGFDSSCLEFRRVHPLLNEVFDTYAVDLMGWGFTDAGEGDLPYGPEQKREHLYEFWKSEVGRPMVLMGCSLGGAVALDFAMSYPEAVEKLVLVDAQGFIDGIGPMSSLPRPLAAAGVGVLKSVWLRQMANKMAYFDTDKFATDDAMRVGRLHTHMPNWSDANVNFMRSGGYALSQKISCVDIDTLVLWGENDEILEKEYATRFEQTMPNAKLVWVPECGHVAHLEQPRFLLDEICKFVGVAGKAPAAA